MATEATHESDNLSTLIFTSGMVIGGLLLGWGIRSLYWSFGWPGEPCLNCALDQVGNTGIDNLGFLPASNWSIGCIVAGVLLMVILNAGAWRRTSGY
ncbi:MAG: hypothetical protein R3F59_26655 [Myxococcota bacterium]